MIEFVWHIVILMITYEYYLWNAVYKPTPIQFTELHKLDANRTQH